MNDMFKQSQPMKASIKTGQQGTVLKQLP